MLECADDFSTCSMYVSLSFVGDTIHLSDIDMIDGTPVLDIKPYIPEYDSPHTRVVEDLEPYDSNTKQPSAAAEEESNVLKLHKVSETDVQSNVKRQRTDDDAGSLLLGDAPEVPLTVSPRVSAQFSPSKDLYNVLEEVKAYVSQGDLDQSKDQVSLSLKSKPPELKVDRPCYGEEAYSTIADWIKEPPVGSLEVRFTPHADRELAEFQPAHPLGKSVYRRWISG